MKRFIGIVFIFIFIFFPSPSYAFEDVSYLHWAYEDINSLSDEGVFGGYEDGTFQPEKYVSLLEIFSIIQRMDKPSDLDMARAMRMYEGFLSSYNISDWAKPGISYGLYKNILYESEINKAYESGLLSDIPKKHSDFPTREEIAVYFGRFLEVAPDYDHSNLAYGDIDTIGKALANDLEVSDYLSPLVDLGVFSSEGSEGNFEPTRPFRRAEMASIVVSSLEFINSER